MIAGDKDPAPCAMETCLAPAARAGHIEGVIASAVTPTRKGEANDWLVRKFPLIGQENGDCRMRFDAQSCRFGDIDDQFYWCTHPHILLPQLQLNARPPGAWLNARDRQLSIGRDRKSTRLNSSHYCATHMPSYACKKQKTKQQ